MGSGDSLSNGLVISLPAGGLILGSGDLGFQEAAEQVLTLVTGGGSEKLLVGGVFKQSYKALVAVNPGLVFLEGSVADLNSAALCPH